VYHECTRSSCLRSELREYQIHRPLKGDILIHESWTRNHIYKIHLFSLVRFI
jgi:hypothetical protein